MNNENVKAFALPQLYVTIKGRLCYAVAYGIHHCPELEFVGTILGLVVSSNFDLSVVPR